MCVVRFKNYVENHQCWFDQPRIMRTTTYLVWYLTLSHSKWYWTHSHCSNMCVVILKVIITLLTWKVLSFCWCDDMRNYCWFVSQEMRFTDGSEIPHRWTHFRVINQYIAGRTEPVVSNIHLVFLSKISTQQENKQRNICVFFSCMIMI